MNKPLMDTDFCFKFHHVNQLSMISSTISILALKMHDDAFVQEPQLVWRVENIFSLIMHYLKQTGKLEQL